MKKTMIKRYSFFIWTLLIFYIFLVGCNKEVIPHDYTFKGENELWKAELRVKGKEIFTKVNIRLEYDSESESTFSLAYKGDIEELKIIKNLTYSYEGSAGGGESSMKFDSPPTKKVFTSNSSSKGGAIYNKDDVIKFIIEVNGIESSFNLVNDK